jgi:hypothetical protein
MTLVELLVVIAVLTIVASISLVSLQSSRERSRAVKSLMNLSSHSRGMSAYAGEYREYFPRFLEVGSFSQSLVGGGVLLHALSYFDMHMTWHVALADNYFQVPATHEVFRPPWEKSGSTALRELATSYHYPCAFGATSEYWDPTTRFGSAQWTGTTLGQVAFPESKALVVVTLPSTPIGEPTGAQVAQVDGSVRERRVSTWLQGYALGDGFQFRFEGAVHFYDVPSLLHTVRGAAGKDFR